MQQIKLLTIVFGLMACEAKPPAHTWKETDGVLVMEAEDGLYVADVSGWKMETTFSGYNGNGYVVWRGPGDWGPEKKTYNSISRKGHVISFPFTITNPGVYYVKVLNYHLEKDGDNDVWTSVDKGDWGKTYDWQINAWTTDERGEWAKVTLTTGDHLVELAGRSEGFAVDQVIIFQERLGERFIPKMSNQANDVESVRKPDKISK